MSDYTPADLSDVTLPEAIVMLERIHKIASSMTCTRSYTPEDVCEIGAEISFIIERLDD